MLGRRGSSDGIDISAMRAERKTGPAFFRCPAQRAPRACCACAATFAAAGAATRAIVCARALFRVKRFAALCRRPRRVVVRERRRKESGGGERREQEEG